MCVATDATRYQSMSNEKFSCLKQCGQCKLCRKTCSFLKINFLTLSHERYDYLDNNEHYYIFQLWNYHIRERVISQNLNPLGHSRRQKHPLPGQTGNWFISWLIGKLYKLVLLNLISVSYNCNRSSKCSRKLFHV